MDTVVDVIDLHFQEKDNAIGSFLIRTSDGPVLIETGPESTFSALKEGLARLGLQPSDIHAVLLTHIHFDHAGAAWKFAEQGAKIYVHPKGLPHLANPEKLWNSAAQIYGDDMERLWGEMQPIPEAQLIAADDGDILDFGDIQVGVFYTPGHAIHHNAYQIGDVIFTGDVAGCKVGDGPVVPPCPPPDIHIPLWKSSIKKLRDAKPRALYLTHYGRQEDVEILLENLDKELDVWADFIKSYYDKGTASADIVPLFMSFTSDRLRKQGLSDEQIQVYEYANPSWMSVNGLLRYWKLKEQGRI